MLTNSAICPGIFSPTSAQDGILSRIRIPGGILNGDQPNVIANLANQFGDRYIQITNRANIQIRGTQTAIPADSLKCLQNLGLAAANPALDPIRNIMASPTAGIDIQVRFNVIPLFREWNSYLSTHSELAILSSKFSVGFDGGEAVSIADRPNDIKLSAVKIDGEICLRLALSMGDRGESPVDVGVAIAPEQSLELLAGLTEVYRQYISQNILEEEKNSNRPPRLRQLMNEWGIEPYLATVEKLLSFRLQRYQAPKFYAPISSYQHLGSHNQSQYGYAYLGVVIPLGRLHSNQWHDLCAIASLYGNGEIRLTPWQNLLIPYISTSEIKIVKAKIEDLGMSTSASHPFSAIAACSGITGCIASATNTQLDASAIADHLERTMQLDQPINIHVTGCEKSCAQHHQSDITLLGLPRVEAEIESKYRIYLGDRKYKSESKFGSELYLESSFSEIPSLIEQILKLYQTKTAATNQSFSEFVNSYAIADLRKLLEKAGSQMLVIKVQS